ncbi:MAG: hemin uptake protein HemP [Pseudomonadota bacterium]
MNAQTPETVLTLTTNRPSHDARTLTGEDGCAMIVLDGQIYTLRITRAGKLILTK